MRIRYVLALLCSVASFASFAADCPADLSHLNARLPRYPSDPDITNIRQQLIATRIGEALDRAHAQGLSTAQAAQAALAQADEAKRVEAASEEAARAYSAQTGADFATTMTQLKNGSFNAQGRPLPPLFGGVVAAEMARIGMVDVAAAFGCLARQRQ